MGRTIDTFATRVDLARSDLALFRRGLRREDQGLFDALFESARTHAQAGALLSPADPFPVILLCMLLEEKKTRIRLEERIRELERRIL